MWLQDRCNGKAVRDFAPAAILLDPQEILRQDDRRICDAVSVSKQDKPPGAAVWHYGRLIPGNTSATGEAGLKARRPFLSEGGLGGGCAAGRCNEKSKYSITDLSLEYLGHASVTHCGKASPFLGLSTSDIPLPTVFLGTSCLFALSTCFYHSSLNALREP
jgi:hypothetical protein